MAKDKRPENNKKMIDRFPTAEERWPRQRSSKHL